MTRSGERAAQPLIHTTYIGREVGLRQITPQAKPVFSDQRRVGVNRLEEGFREIMTMAVEAYGLEVVEKRMGRPQGIRLRKR